MATEKRKLVFTRRKVRWSDQPPTSAIKANRREWLLIRELLAREHIFWLDAFTIFPTWHDRKVHEDYWNMFLRVKDEVPKYLALLGIREAEIEPTGGGRFRLNCRFESGPDSNITDATRFAQSSLVIFQQGEDGWAPIRQSFSAGWIDATSVAHAVAAAPNLSDIPENYKGCLKDVVIALDERRVALTASLAKLAKLSPQQLPMVTTDEVRDAICRWVDELLVVRDALSFLESKAPSLLVDTSTDIGEFVTLANEFATWWADRHSHSKKGANTDSYVMEREASDLLNKIKTCSWMELATKTVKDALRESPPPRIPESDVDEARMEAICDFILGQPSRIRPTEALFVQFCGELERHARGSYTSQVLLELHVSDKFSGDEDRKRLVESLVNAGETSRSQRIEKIVDTVMGADFRTVEKLGEEVQSLSVKVSGLKEARQNTESRGLSRRQEKQLREQLREHLREEAVRELKRQLRSDSVDDYVPLRLEVGRLSSPTERAVEEGSQDPFGFDRVWIPLGEDRLVSDRRCYFLSSVSGAGKTTFLRHIQQVLLAESELVPVFLRAQDLAADTPLGWVCVREKLAAKFHGTAPKMALNEALDGLRKRRTLALLVDGLDNLGLPGMNCSEICGQILSVFGSSLVIMAGRPSAARWVQAKVPVQLLRLQAFGDKACREFFGNHYSRAHALCHGDMTPLRTPMLAYIVRALVRTRKDGRLKSLWDLYWRFLRHVLYEQDSNIQTRHHDQWAWRVRNALGAASYRAICQHPPAWNSISLTVLEGLPKDCRMPFDEIPSAGLADLLEIESTDLGPHLVFSHQSFQEFFAAYWASLDDGRVEHILSQSWDPRWQETLKFLAGAPGGKSAVGAIYPNDCTDNAIHSRLFLAGECATGASVQKCAGTRLVERLSQLVKNPFWRNRAMDILARMRSPEANDVVWRQFEKAVVDDNISVADTPAFLIGPLYTSDRLAWLLSQTRRKATPAALFGLAQWAAMCPRAAKNLAMKHLCDPNDNVFQACTVVLQKISDWLCEEDMDHILAELAPAIGGLGTRQMIVATAIRHRTNERQSLRLLQLALHRIPLDPVGMYVLATSDLTDRLGAEGVDIIFEAFVHDDDNVRQTICKYMKHIADRLSMVQVDSLLHEFAAESDANVMHALSLLQGRHRGFSRAQVEWLVACLRHHKFCPLATRVCVANIDALDSSEKSLVVSKCRAMLSEDRNAQLAALEALNHLANECDTGLEGQLMQLMAIPEVADPAIEVLSYLAGRARISSIEEVVHYIVGGGSELHGVTAQVKARFAPHLNREMREHVLSAACVEGGESGLLDLIDPAGITRNESLVLEELLQSTDRDMAARASKVLEAAHGAGRLEH